MLKGQRRERVIRFIIASLILPFFTAVVGPGIQSSYAAASCTGEKIIGIEYSKNRLNTESANLAWRRGTNTALSSLLPTILEYKRGTHTALSIASMATLALDNFKKANPSLTPPVLDYFDDGYDTDTAVSKAQEWVTNPCFMALIGPMQSYIAKAVIPIYSSAGIPILSPSASDPSLTTMGASTFHRLVLPEDPQDLRTINTLKTLGITKPAVFEDNQYTVDRISRWARSPGLPIYSLLEWKRGTPTVTVKTEMIIDAKAKGVNGYLFNGMSNYGTVNYSDDFGDAWPIVGEFTEACPNCSGLVFGEYTNAAFIDYKYFADTGVEGARILSTSIPFWYGIPELAFSDNYYAQEGPYATPAYDALSFALEGIKAGSSTPQALNAFINTKKYNGISGPISFDTNGELVGRSQLVFTVVKGERILTSGLPSGYVANGAISNYAPTSASTINVPIQVKDFDESLTAARMDVHVGQLVKRYPVSSSGQITVALPNGTSYISIIPDDENEIGIRRSQFEIVITSGAVSSFKNMTTGSVISNSSSRYQLRLATPSAIGTVASPFSYAGEQYSFEIQQTPAENYALSMDGRFRSDNKIYITAVARYGSRGNLYANNREDWSHRGTSEETFTAANLSGSGFNFTITPPLAKITGQVTGSFGPESIAQVMVHIKDFSYPEARSLLSSDGHFGFTNPGSKGSLFSIQVIAKTGNIARATARTSQFTAAALETGTVTGLVAALPANNVSGIATLEGVGEAGALFMVTRTTGNNRSVLASRTDSSGRFVLGLPTDTYTITFQGGYLENFNTTSITCVIKAGMNTCDAVLGVPTVTGAVTGFPPISYGSIGFLSEIFPGKWGYANKNVWAYLRPDGTFTGFVAPGTYLMNLSLNTKGISYGIPAGKCVIPNTGKVTCNVSFTGGLSFKVKNRNGTDFSGPLGFTISSMDTAAAFTSTKGTLRSSAGISNTLPLLDGKYSVVLDPHSNSADIGAMTTFNFSVINNQVLNVLAVESQTVLAPASGIFTLQLAAPQFEGKVLNYDGTTGNKYSAIWLQPSGSTVLRLGNTDLEGKFINSGNIKFSDGTYTIWATPVNLKFSVNQAETIHETFTITNGRADRLIELHERAPNVRGKLTGPNGPLANTQINFNSIEMKKLGYYFQNTVTTDSSGNFSVYLIPGQNYASVWGDSSRGFVGFSAEINITESATVWNLTAHAPNIYSKVTIAGKSYDYSYHYFQNEDKNGYGSEAYEWYRDSTNFLASYLSAGRYRLQVGVYYRDSGGTTSAINLISKLCVVPETGTVNCDLELPSINLNYSVLDYRGINTATGTIGGAIELISDVDNSIISSAAKSNGSKNSQGRYLGALEDGSYRLRIYPNVKSATNGTSESYLFDVISGVVKNMRTEGSTEILQPVDGAYQLKLRSPSLSGRVLKSDGTTPVSQTQVFATLRNREFYEYTDSDGYFSFDLGSNVTDGTYQVSARANYGDVTQGDSMESSVAISGGVSSSITLRLRTPNVTGVVSGPLGVSRNNWVYAYRILGNGGLQGLRWGNQSTNQNGQFGLWLEPGNYLFNTQDDFQIAGGAAARNVLCAVPSTGSVVCNLTLVAPNVRGTFTKNGVVQIGQVYIEKKNSSGYFEGTDQYSNSNQNGWAVKLGAGTYRANGYSYNDNFYYRSREFTIVDTDTAIIPIVVPEVNLRAQVVSASGVVQTNRTKGNSSSIYVIEKTGNGKDYGLGEQVNFLNSSGIMEFRLNNGIYNFVLRTEDSQQGTQRNFNVTIESGTVKSATDQKTGVAVSVVNGLLQFQLNQPGLSGTVVASDGVTPVPQASIGYFFNGQVCPWCERNWASSGSNGYFAFGDVSDGQYQVYARPLDSDITKGTSELSAVSVTNGQAQNGLILSLRDANVTGSVRALPAQFNAAYIQVRKFDDYGNSYTPYGTYNLQANSQGNFGLYLAPGTYRFTSTIYSEGWSKINSGFSQNCVVPSSGRATCDISVNTSNISVMIVAPGTQSPLLYSNLGIYSMQYSKSLATTNPPVSQDANGIFKSFLEDGIWRIWVGAPYNSSLYTDTYFTATVSDGVVTRIENESGESVTPISGIYRLSPKASNLRGNITFNSNPYLSQAYVRVQTDQNGWYNEITGRWSYGGTFGLNVPAGTYRLVVDPNSDGSPNSPVITTIYNCVVPESGTVTCNVPLSSGNLSGRIVDETGATYRQAYVNLFSIGDDKRWDYVQVSVNNGIFRSNLADGKYRIVVVPYWEVRGNYTEHSYDITVTGGSISLVRDLRTNETVSATAGVYDFILGTPAIRGKVLAPGSSTLSIPSVEIRVGQDRSARNWQFSTQSDAMGNFALTVPDGNYVIQATPFGSNFRYGKSETQTVIVINGVATSQMTLRLREPNLTGRVVTPGANPSPVAGVNVNMWIGDEYFYTYTSADGTFGAFVENPTPGCPNKCSMELGYTNSTDLSSKRYTINTIGNLGDKALGGVSTRVTVLAPTSGSASTPNRYGYVAIEKWNAANSQYEWQPGYQTNEIGVAGLGLDVGEKYRITAHPGDGKNALFSPKVIEVDSFSAIDSPTITITFDRPNLSLQVSNIAGAKNMYGWYQVNKYDSGSGKYLFFKNAYLDDQGKGALLLPQGDYTIHFWPGKINAGVEKEILVSINSSGVASGTSVVNSVATITLPNGNISGFVKDQSTNGISAAIVTAIRNDDVTKMASTVTSSTGYYELNLDRTYAWTIKAIEPVSTSTGQYSLGTSSPANAAISNADIAITITS